MNATTVLDALRENATRAPEHCALLVDEGEGRSRAISYAELVTNFEARAEALRTAGLERGDRCGLQAKQGAGFVELALGILDAGACLTPIPDDHKGDVLEAFLRRCQVHHHVEESAAHTSVPFAFRSFGKQAEDAELAFRALEPAYLRFTSGTTSLRKGVVLSHRSVLERLRAANRGLAIRAEDRVLWLLPMAHHFVVSILLYLQQGATVLLPGSSLAKPVLEFAHREGATVAYASPHHYKQLSAAPSELGLDALRLAISTADGLRIEIAEAFSARFGQPLTQALGIIEVGLSVINSESAAQKPGALGRPLPDYDVWLRDEKGAPLAESSPDHTGEICIRGPGLVDAYLDPWTPAQQLLEPDGFRTGDQGWFDADGDLHLAGRRANRISMAGMKFFAEEVEAVLENHPGIRECRVFAREHAQLGEIPAAEFVASDPEAAPDRKELARHCREQLPTYKIPREFKVVAELERTSSGKLRRRIGA